MKKVIVLSATLLAFAAPAFATIDMSWNACPAQGGTADVTISCADPSGLATLYSVVSTPLAITSFVALDCSIDLQVDQLTLTQFHNFQDPVVNPSGCNDGWIFGDEKGPAATCAASGFLWGTSPPNVGGSQGTAAAGYAPLIGGVNRGRFVTTVFRSSTAPIDLVAGTAYFGWKIDFYSLQATEAGGTCTGCTVPMRIAFNQANFGSLASSTGVEAAPVVVTQPGTFGIETSTFGGGNVPLGATAVQNKSWGALKSLYR